MDTPTSSPPKASTLVVLVLAAACLVLGAIYLVRGGSGGGGPGGGEPGREAPGPVFENADPGVAATGSAACLECHAEYAPYLDSAHARSVAAVDVERVGGLPATFHHERSDLHYRVYAQDGALRMEEGFALDPEKQDERRILEDRAMAWEIGAGRSYRAYLHTHDGFLFQAPLVRRGPEGAWGMAPGYDGPFHPGFSQAVSPTCVRCHAGQVERVDDAVHKVAIHETAIGCERCHGHGALHAERRKGGAAAGDGGADPSIAGVGRMSRSQQMDLCADCHMDHTVTVPRRGRRSSEWRPGMPAAEVRVPYRLPDAGQDGSLLGHVDPLRASACFQKSDTLTCLTCHRVHGAAAEPAARREVANDACRACHEACSRVSESGVGTVPPKGDDCSGCHMPRRKDPEPHTPQTEHRIGIPGLTWRPPARETSVPELEPLADLSGLGELERARGLGIAYLLESGRRSWPPRALKELRKRAEENLQRAQEHGTPDPRVEAALAFLYQSQGDAKRALKHARAALEITDDGPSALRPDRRATCLRIVVESELADHHHEAAERHLDELAALRMDAADMLLRVELLRNSGRVPEAAEVAARAVELWPNNPDVQYRAAEIYGQLGREADQALHGLIGTRLHKLLSRPPR